jgi:IS5 family transposase
MVEKMLSMQSLHPQALLADSGYFSADNVQKVREREIDPYIAVGRESTDAGAPAGQQSPKTLMREKLRGKAGKAVYSRRKVIVEPVFGQIEQSRGFRRFSQRGRVKVRREWAFVCLTHNLLKLFRHRQIDRPENTPPELPCMA